MLAMSAPWGAVNLRSSRVPVKLAMDHLRTHFVGRADTRVEAAEADDRPARGREPMKARPVATHGLTHVALAVKDPARSFEFYRKLIGVVEVYRDTDFVQAQTPGTRDVLVFERSPRDAGRVGGIRHFGFRLQRPDDMPAALAAIQAAGGEVREHGEFVPGEPYVFFSDPDGYEVEIWYEIPTPVDPPDS
jgi:catechol 2,3-dioxygenase-like lactoylglutathione lyase family enzyme